MSGQAGKNSQVVRLCVYTVISPPVILINYFSICRYGGVLNKNTRSAFAEILTLTLLHSERPKLHGVLANGQSECKRINESCLPYIIVSVCSLHVY